MEQKDAFSMRMVYSDWFAANRCAVVLTRPDSYLFGAASDLQGAEELVSVLASLMR